MATIEERVRAGATLLDSTVPGWAGKIDATVLQMSSCAACVIGQLFGGYDNGCDQFGLDQKREIALGFEHSMAADRWGDLSHEEYKAKSQAVDAEYAALRTAWLAEIDARLQTPEAEEARIEALPAAKEASPL